MSWNVITFSIVSRTIFSLFKDVFNSTHFNSLALKGVGHGNPSMSMAIAEAAGRYGHVMFPSNLHPPAVQLAQYLLEKGPGKGWANRVFYSGTNLK
jgi:adenosylmethionine-8-amino-7-oxononanoate aminotransferase